MQIQLKLAQTVKKGAHLHKSSVMPPDTQSQYMHTLKHGMRNVMSQFHLLSQNLEYIYVFTVTIIYIYIYIYLPDMFSA